MKKSIFLILLFSSYIYSVDRDITAKVYGTVFSELYQNRDLVYVYIQDNSYLKYFNKKSIKATFDISKATVALVSSAKELEKVVSQNRDLAIFTTKQRILYKSDNVIGGFYWTKGRRQLIFIEERLNRYHISLPDEYKRYTIERL